MAVDAVVGVAANHLPSTPWPFTCPAAVSLAKVCNGQPLYVTWVSAAPLTMTETVASAPVTADDPVGVPVATSGGHALRQPPVHAPIVEFCSGRK